MKEELDKTSADYKPEEVEYKDIEHNNSSTLIDAFVNNSTIEESKEHEEIIEEKTKQEEIIEQESNNQNINNEVEVPKFCKTMNTVLISAMTFIIISFFLMITKSYTAILSYFGLYLSIFILPVDIFAIIEELFLLRGKSEEEKSAIFFYIILNIAIGIILIIYLGFCYVTISNSFNLGGLG